MVSNFRRHKILLPELFHTMVRSAVTYTTGPARMKETFNLNGFETIVQVIYIMIFLHFVWHGGWCLNQSY
uniref:Uncharacterized protein n=1 Tax=Octopus bimaculoides TaxID=37653 RepID=A0A0L8GWB0_OCTBM